MFNSAVLDVAVGLIFTFLTVSLVCGLITETVATFLSWRSNTLLAGVQALVNDPGFNKLALHLYKHALVNPRDDGKADTPEGMTNKPSYIDPQHFAGAMIDTLKLLPGAPDQIKASIAGSPLIKDDAQMVTMLNGMVDRASGDLNQMKNALAAWFDSGMDRVSGSYKRRTQIFCFGFGLIIAVGLNVDSLQVARALWQQPQVSHALTPSTDLSTVQSELDSLSLPIGWAEDGSQCPRTLYGWLARLVGWIITALSTLFGATFWFDAMSGLLKLRGSGPSPDDKKSRAATS